MFKTIPEFYISVYDLLWHRPQLKRNDENSALPWLTAKVLADCINGLWTVLGYFIEILDALEKFGGLPTYPRYCTHLVSWLL